jgi:translation initiation factor 6 (eIF-6)
VKASSIVGAILLVNCIAALFIATGQMREVRRLDRINKDQARKIAQLMEAIDSQNTALSNQNKALKKQDDVLENLEASLKRRNDIISQQHDVLMDCFVINHKLWEKYEAQ